MFWKYTIVVLNTNWLWTQTGCERFPSFDSITESHNAWMCHGGPHAVTLSLGVTELKTMSSRNDHLKLKNLKSNLKCRSNLKIFTEIQKLTNAAKQDGHQKRKHLVIIKGHHWLKFLLIFDPAAKRLAHLARASSLSQTVNLKSWEPVSALITFTASYAWETFKLCSSGLPMFMAPASFLRLDAAA